MSSKANLDSLPVELLFMISSYLPNVQSAARFSCVSRSLYYNLHDSKNFWFSLGCQTNPRFQTIDEDFDYYSYTAKAAVGSFKDTCQLCLRMSKNPQADSLEIESLGKVLCDSCLRWNIVPADPVERIKGINTYSFPMFFRELPREKRQFDVPLFKAFYWLPSVKLATEAVYKKPWAMLLKEDFRCIRPLVSWQECLNYGDKSIHRIEEAFRSQCRKRLPSFITEDIINSYRARAQKRLLPVFRMNDIWTPAEGQVETEIETKILHKIDSIIDTILGLVEYREKSLVAVYSPLWREIRAGHEERLVSQSKNWNKATSKCSICMSTTNLETRKPKIDGIRDPLLKSKPDSAECANDKEYSPWSYAAHVLWEHPEWILREDWGMVKQ